MPVNIARAVCLIRWRRNIDLLSTHFLYRALSLPASAIAEGWKQHRAVGATNKLDCRNRCDQGVHNLHRHGQSSAGESDSPANLVLISVVARWSDIQTATSRCSFSKACAAERSFSCNRPPRRQATTCSSFWLSRTPAVAPELTASQQSYRTSATGERISGMAGGSRSWRG